MLPGGKPGGGAVTVRVVTAGWPNRTGAPAQIANKSCFTRYLSLVVRLRRTRCTTAAELRLLKMPRTLKMLKKKSGRWAETLEQYAPNGHTQGAFRLLVTDMLWYETDEHNSNTARTHIFQPPNRPTIVHNVITPNQIWICFENTLRGLSLEINGKDHS